MSDVDTIHPAPDEAEYREQVLERFTTRARSLTKQFTILIIFAFGFLVFIIVPLAALNFDAAHGKAQKAEIEKLTAQSEALEAKRATQEQKVGILQGNISSLNDVLDRKSREAKARDADRKRLKTDLSQNDARQQTLQNQAKSLESAAKGVEKTLASFDAGQRVDDLRNWFSVTAFASDRDPACESADRSVYIGCLVRKKLEADWGRDFSLVRREVVEPLRKIAPDVAEAIESELSAVKETFGERLEENRDFWRSVTGKTAFMGGLSGDFKQAFGDIGKIVTLRLEFIAQQSKSLEAEITESAQAGQALEDHIAALDRELTEIGAETEARSRELDGELSAIANIESAQAELADKILRFEKQLADLPKPEDIEAAREIIEKRLNGLASPFGDIPISLKEALLAYPLILTAGFMICTLLLSRLLALRREFRDSLAREQTLTEENVKRRVATLAPLWFDSGRAFWGNPTLVLALLIPIALFVVTGWLTLNDWLLPLGKTASAENLRWFYGGLYGLGLAVFATGLFRVQSAWTRDRAMPLSTNPVS